MLVRPRGDSGGLKTILDRAPAILAKPFAHYGLVNGGRLLGSAHLFHRAVDILGIYPSQLKRLGDPLPADQTGVELLA